MTQKNKYNLRVGSQIESFYGNGIKICNKSVVRITDASCYFDSHGGHRDSWNTVNNKIKDELYKVL